jgi:hypothetical protein
MRHTGKDTISPKEVMVDLKGSHLSNSPNRGRHRQAHLESLQHCIGNIPVIRPTSFSSTPYGQLPGAPGRPPISLPTKRFKPAAEPPRTDVAGIADLPPLPEIAYDEFDADYESDDSLYLGGDEGKAPTSLKHTEFSLKQFAKKMGSPTLVHSTSGRKYGWLGYSRRSIGQLSRYRTV